LKSNLLKRAVNGFLSFQLRHPILILILALALSALSIWYTVSNLTFQTSQNDLVSPSDRLIQLAQQTSQFTQMDAFVVVIESASRSRSLKFLNALTPRLKGEPENFQNVFSRIDPDLFKPWALFYLDEKDLVTITRNIRNNADLIRNITDHPSLENFFSLLNQEMASRFIGELFTGFLDGNDTREEPFDLDFLIRLLKEMKKYLRGNEHFVSPWAAFLNTESFEVDPEQGHFWAGENERYLLCFVTPARHAELTGTWDSLNALRRNISELKNRFPDVEAGVTGPEALNADQMKTAVDDMTSATLISAFALAALFIYFRRGVRIPLLEIATLAIALSWSFGLTTLFIGHLNILSVTFAPLLLGLGVDFGAHWFARMREQELAHPGSKTDVLLSTMQKVGPAMLIMGFSLTLAFFPLVLSGFKGLIELGLICTIGMIAMALASLLLLPPLVQVFATLNPKIHSGTPMDWIKVPVSPFIRLTRKRALVFLTVGTAAFLAASWSASGVRFDLNMLNLQADNVESVVWEKKLLEETKLSSLFGEILVPTLKDVRVKTGQLESLPSVSRTESLLTLLPQGQEKKTKILRSISPLMNEITAMRLSDHPIDPDRISGVLNRIRSKLDPFEAAESGAGRSLVEQMTAVRKLIDEVNRLLHSANPEREQRAMGRFEREFFEDLNAKLSLLKANVNSNPMRWEDLPGFLRERYMAKNGLFIIRAYPMEDIWDPPAMGRFVREIRTVSPDAVGDPVTMYIFSQAFRDACIKAAFYGILFIFLFSFLIFRDIKTTFLMLIPFLVGTVWTVGLMRPLGISFNLANTLFLPLIVGAGVAYGVVIISRWRQLARGGEVILPQSTALGVLLAGLTAVAGFGSLMISSHQGIFSLGLLATIGSLAVTAAALLYLPAVIYFTLHKK
jgi:hypothetical protein